MNPTAYGEEYEPIPKSLELTIIQTQPEGKKGLIIWSLSGLIEQMCFEIGQLIIAMPVMS